MRNHHSEIAQKFVLHLIRYALYLKTIDIDSRKKALRRFVQKVNKWMALQKDRKVQMNM